MKIMGKNDDNGKFQIKYVIIVLIFVTVISGFILFLKVKNDDSANDGIYSSDASIQKGYNIFIKEKELGEGITYQEIISNPKHCIDKYVDISGEVIDKGEIKVRRRIYSYCELAVNGDHDQKMVVIYRNAKENDSLIGDYIDVIGVVKLINRENSEVKNKKDIVIYCF